MTDDRSPTTGAPRVLVTGASIAGPAVALLLDRCGFEVTVLEQFPALREGGQNIDVRGTGREVLRRLGLEDAVRDRNTGEVGTRFVDEEGRTVSELGLDPDRSADGPTAELEILRGALSQVLVDACPDSVAWWFGDRVVAVDQDADGVDVTLERGRRQRFDLLVVAEGVGSRTRSIVLGDEVQEDALGMYSAYGTIERRPHDDDWWRVLVAPEGYREAFAQYESWMRPVVEDAQNLPPGVPRLAAPRTRAGVQVFRWAARLAGTRPVRRLTERVTSGPQSEGELPDLEDAAARAA